MNNSIMNILNIIYKYVPLSFRPYLKHTFLWLNIRIKAILSLKKIYKGKRVEFIDFEIANLEPYEILGPGREELLIEAYCSAISPGTETAVLCGLPGARRAFPYTPGYSASGTVTRKGSKVLGIDVGDRVAGRLHHVNKGIMKSKEIFKVPDNVSFEDASMIELGIITLQGVRKAKIRPGDRVAVVGQGFIGQMSNILAKMLGAVEVIAVANSKSREHTAQAAGCVDYFFSTKEENKLIENIDADVVIEAVGHPQAISTAISIAKNGGRVVLLGSSRGLGRDVKWMELAQRRNIEVVGAHISALPERDCSTGRWTYRQEGMLYLELLQGERMRVRDLVTWRAKPEECNSVYEVLANGGGKHVGIIIHWNEGL